MTDLLRSKKWLISLCAGVLLFGAGLLILRHNPYWREEPGQPGILDHHVYACNAIGHLTSAAGLVSVLFSIALLLSRLFGKWSMLYWLVIIAGIIAWWSIFGMETTYGVSYAWDRRRGGITEFTISSADSRPTWLSRQLIWWQVQPELSNYIGGSPLKRTHGSIAVSVVRIVPIAIPTLACDCFHCCEEEAQGFDSAR